MSRPLPPPSWLRTFEAAARHMSFTRAAEELHVTQSAVSQQIRLLEDCLGLPLFNRLPQSLSLTEAGRAYLPVVRDAFDQLTRGTQEVFGCTRSELVTLRSTPGFGEYWLAPRMGDLFAKHPDIELRVTSTIWNAEFVESGVDLEVRYGVEEWPELATRRLTEDQLVPVCSPTLAAQLGEDPAALADARLLHVDGFRSGWAEWLQYADVSEQVEAGAGSHFDTAILPLKLAQEGLGVALGRRPMIDPLIEDGRLVAPFGLPMPTEEAFYLAWPADEELAPAVEKVRDWMIEQGERGRDDHGCRG